MAAPTHPNKNPRVALFIPSLRCGGAERMTVNLARAMVGLGVPVDVVLGSAEGELIVDIPEEARVIDLGVKHVRRAIFPLARYLRKEKPYGLIARMNHTNVSAWVARLLARSSCKLVVTEATNWSRLLEEGTPWRRFRHRFQVLPLVRIAYRHADSVVAVSQGVADDLSSFVQLPKGKLSVVPNPVVDDNILLKAAEEPRHPWLYKSAMDNSNNIPVLLAVGSLRPAKDFATLLHAVARVRESREVRLIILGQGEERGALEALREKLGLTQCVDMPGFCSNPYALYARVSLFVLSSIREGSPNVLTEALACGCPCVATDCPTGPAEILADGRYGPLVPPGNAEKMAQAILETLENPHTSQHLKQSASRFTARASAISYLKQLEYPVCFDSTAQGLTGIENSITSIIGKQAKAAAA